MTEQIPEGFQERDGFVAEYLAACATLDLPLPAGASLPAEPPPEEEPTLYEIGAGDVEALFAWRAIVERAALDAIERGDPEEALRWILAAARFVTTDTYARFNDHSARPSYFDAVIAPALNGDFSALAAEARH